MIFFRADESGTVSGTLDLLMDTLISTMAPLFSLLNKVGGFFDFLYCFVSVVV